jgi:hydrogenase maturation protease
VIAIIGCGNLNRQDDGVGPEVIRALKERGLEGPRVKLLDAGTDGMSVMFAARNCTALVVVDAARMEAEPGSIYEVPGAELERPYVPGLNLHDFRWNDALHAGRKIFREAFPRDVMVLLVGAHQFGFGIGLSDAVRSAVGNVTQRIEILIAQHLAKDR